MINPYVLQNRAVSKAGKNKEAYSTVSRVNLFELVSSAGRDGDCCSRSTTFSPFMSFAGDYRWKFSQAGKKR